MKSLFIYLLTENDNQASWIIADESGHIEQTVLKGNLIDLAQNKINFDVTIMIPGQVVLLTEVNLPKMNRQRLLQALPFALEEQLIDDVNDLHFALGEVEPDMPIPVAILNKSKMDAWLTHLKQMGIFPHRMISSMFALPFDDFKNWVMVEEEGICLVRTGFYSGFVCDKNNFNTYLELQLLETLKKPTHLKIYSFAETKTQETLHPFTHDTLTIENLKITEKNFLHFSFKELKNQPYINLLQGKYHAKPKARFTKHVWTIALSLGFVWLLLLFSSHLGSFFILNRALTHTEEATNQIYKKHFPEATAIVAPRERLESKLKKIANDANKNQALTLLSLVGKSLDQTSDIHLQHLDFRDNLVNLAIIAKTFNDLDRFTQSLTEQGLKVKQQNAGTAGSEVKANILINKGAL